jgi:hypothetical protein
MNCKKGDMAMYIGKMAEFRGHIVKCVELDGDFGPPAWVIEPMLGTYDVAFDRCCARSAIPARARSTRCS